jgi:hypothetical protein
MVTMCGRMVFRPVAVRGKKNEEKEVGLMEQLANCSPSEAAALMAGAAGNVGQHCSGGRRRSTLTQAHLLCQWARMVSPAFAAKEAALGIEAAPLPATPTSVVKPVLWLLTETGSHIGQSAQVRVAASAPIDPTDVTRFVPVFAFPESLGQETTAAQDPPAEPQSLSAMCAEVDRAAAARLAVTLADRVLRNEETALETSRAESVKAFRQSPAGAMMAQVNGTGHSSATDKGALSATNILPAGERRRQMTAAAELVKSVKLEEGRGKGSKAKAGTEAMTESGDRQKRPRRGQQPPTAAIAPGSRVVVEYPGTPVGGEVVSGRVTATGTTYYVVALDTGVSDYRVEGRMVKAEKRRAKGKGKARRAK